MATPQDFGTPEFGQTLSPSHASQAMREALLLRRSTQADQISEPGPDNNQLRDMLTIAARVPDHRKVVPFRFILFQGEARVNAGQKMQEIFAQNNPDASKEECAKQARRFLRAPVIVGVISTVNPEHRTPEWEQVLSAGAVCENLLLASSAYGFAAQWLTEWYAYDADILKAFGLKVSEKIAGFIYIGTAKTPPKERQRPDLDALISHFK